MDTEQLRDQSIYIYMYMYIPILSEKRVDITSTRLSNCLSHSTNIYHSQWKFVHRQTLCKLSAQLSEQATDVLKGNRNQAIHACQVISSAFERSIASNSYTVLCIIL